MEQTAKFYGLSLDQIEKLVATDPKMMKDIVPLGAGSILKFAAICFLIVLALCIFGAITNPQMFTFTAIIFYSILILIGLGVLLFVASRRRTVESRLRTSYLVPELEITYAEGKLVLLRVGQMVWRDVPGLLGHMNEIYIGKLWFVDYGRGYSVLFARCYQGGAVIVGGGGGHLKYPVMVLTSAEKERLSSMLSSFKNAAAGGLLLTSEWDLLQAAERYRQWNEKHPG
jgi:hypothetical protein